MSHCLLALDVDSGLELRRLEFGNGLGHARNVECCCLAYSPRGDHLALGFNDGSLCIVQADSAHLLLNVPMLLNNDVLEYSPNGEILVAVCRDEPSLHILESGMYTLLGTVELPAEIVSVTFAPGSSDRLIVGCFGGHVACVEMSSLTISARFQLPRTNGYASMDDDNCMVCAPSDDTVVASFHSKAFLLMISSSLTLVRHFDFGVCITCLALDPCSRSIAAGSKDGHVFVLDVGLANIRHRLGIARPGAFSQQVMSLAYAHISG